jgi:uncharacterized protein (TIGR03000 family)
MNAALLLLSTTLLPGSDVEAAAPMPSEKTAAPPAATTPAPQAAPAPAVAGPVGPGPHGPYAPGYAGGYPGYDYGHGYGYGYGYGFDGDYGDTAHLYACCRRHLFHHFCHKHRLAGLLARLHGHCWNCGCYGGPNCCCGGGCGGGCGDGHGDCGCGGGPGPVVAGAVGTVPGAGAVSPAGGAQVGTVQPVSLSSRDEASQAARARLVVEMPEGARLFIDDRPVAVRSGEATFRTPALEPGEEYYYQVRVEVERDGRTLQESRKVVFRAGDDLRTTFFSSLTQASR